MKTTVCKRCGRLLRFDEDKNMWLQPGRLDIEGRWCPGVHPAKKHDPALSRIREDSK